MYWHVSLSRISNGTVFKASCSIVALCAALGSAGAQAQPGEAETVLITGQRTADEVGAGILGERPVLETPMSVTGYTAALILDQGARTTSEVLANDPSIRVQTPGDGNYDYFSIRGFSIAASAFALNGLYGVLPWNTMSPQAVEQFEVIRGPATTFAGAAPFDNPGGSINIQPKRRCRTPVRRKRGVGCARQRRLS
jgi:iron complex outermembrane receptor protein